jgi:hypothetical protein
MESQLPNIVSFAHDTRDFSKNSIVILSEGFEDRSLHWISSLSTDIKFKKAIICKYNPERKSRLDDLLPLVRQHSLTEPQIETFFRFEPQKFETAIRPFIHSLTQNEIDEVIIDISVMSKLLIMILLFSLESYNGKVRIIYSEPKEYAPSKKEYLAAKNNIEKLYNLPSIGVHDVVRTSMLSSTVMQRRPNVVIAFTSFNEQLIRALLSVINPPHLLLINGVPPHLHWRERAMQDIFTGIINDYKIDNKLNKEGCLIRKTSTLNYEETFLLISNIYKEYCYSYRIIIAPTGSKMQAVGCALIKICCPDIHIEYPTPESFYFQSYSSKEIRAIHQIIFNNYSTLIKSTCSSYRLNG